MMALMILGAQILSLNATEPALNPKEPVVEYCNLLPKLIDNTTKQSNTEKNLQKKEALNKKISNWKNQLDLGTCKEIENQNCQEIKKAIDASENLLKTSKFTQDGLAKETKRLNKLKKAYENKKCK